MYQFQLICILVTMVTKYGIFINVIWVKVMHNFF